MGRQLPPLTPLSVHIANTSFDRPQSRAMAWLTVGIIFFPWAILVGSGVAAWVLRP